jgi:hypothetical protein
MWLQHCSSAAKNSRIVSGPFWIVRMPSEQFIRFLFAGDDIAGGACLSLNLRHAANLNRRWLLAWLLDFKPDRLAVLGKEQVWDSRWLVRATVNLERPPSLSLC